MAERSSGLEDRVKVWELIKDIKVALMVTTEEHGDRLRGRPMAAINKHFDGELWFATRDETPKVEQIHEHRQVLLAYSDPRSQNYISIAGSSTIVHDPAKIKELWSEALRIWFPDGPDDPSIALIKVDVETAEFWDAPSSAWVYAYGYAKARLTGEPPKNLGENKVVTF